MRRHDRAHYLRQHHKSTLLDYQDLAYVYRVNVALSPSVCGEIWAFQKRKWRQYGVGRGKVFVHGEQRLFRGPLHIDATFFFGMPNLTANAGTQCNIHPIHISLILII